MAKNIVEKILDEHIITGTPKAGEEVGIRVDQTLTQDATGTMACLQFEALGFSKVKTDVSVSYVDHNTIQEGFENADDHRYLETVAAKHGIKFSKPGNGICHQVHLERFGVPGKTLLGSDSHTPTGGGIGMIAIGAGGLDVAVAMGGGPFYMKYPRVVKVELEGALKPWVSAKDVILALLEILSTKGNVGTIVEYGGSGVAGLSVPERATITNMGAELGVTTSVFPSDEKTRAFMVAQGREEGFREISADPGAEYDRVIKIDLSTLKTRAACPHSPGNVKTLQELKGTRVDQVLIGSCTNASYRDIMMVASLLKGKKISPEVTLGVACGSRQVLEMVSRNGALADIIASGARILESACGFCIGNSVAPKTDAVSVRTSNRNFFGRSGTSSADVYLTSPEAAVASALSAELCDPQEYFSDVPYPQIDMPSEFVIDDSMILEPSDNPESIEVYRGPNIGDPPSNDPCPETLNTSVAIKVGDKITTDHIMPAGNRLKYRSNIPKYAEFVFEREDPEFSSNALKNKNEGLHNVIIGGESYGQGSSREHAAICPMYLGVKVVVARSIERIHRANLINFGIIPATFENEKDYDSLQKGDSLVIENVRKAVESNQPLVAKRTSDGAQITLEIDFTDREKEMILAGGLINATKLKQ
ncbi:aconitate hydratase [Chitinispirillales bacterium ANBcel5]|uniref:aconitate hydratase n=1 Tax=Cellulosispirillum alkaliphilum TaxID=3039283 RepID=UPI002A511740|nr:aconitate hydratase [Chitinispirillales bacterium ANBcel5]